LLELLQAAVEFSFFFFFLFWCLEEALVAIGSVGPVEVGGLGSS